MSAGTLLALFSALSWGTGDFFGGMAARRQTARSVLVGSQAVGLVWLLALVPFFAGRLTPATIAIGAAAGVFGGFGLLAFYGALAVGTMSVVAPIAAVVGASVPLVWGLFGGERPSVLAVVGMAAAFPAVWLLAGGGRLQRSRGLGAALAAGVGFGCFFVVLRYSPAGSGLWPVVSARAMSVILQGGLLVASGERPSFSRGATAQIVAVGIFDSSANLLYLLAARRLDLSVVGILASLYPAATVVLAAIVLRERLSGIQRAGLALAGMSVLGIAAG